MAPIPQPFELKLTEPPPAVKPDWSGAMKQLRTVAQWVIGGVVATAAAVFAGGSLSHLGSMSFPEDAQRLFIAFAGVVAGFVAIGFIMFFGLSVLAPAGHNLSEIAGARGLSVDRKARQRLYELHEINEEDYPLAELLEDPEGAAAKYYLPKLRDVAPFCVVRARFERLILCMLVCVPVAVIGFGLFAWAANPPDKATQPARGILLKITY